MTVSGDVHLILTKGHTLTVKKGIYVKDGSSLTIYGQPNGDGTLVTTGEEGQAGIGGFNGAAHNAPIAITIHGGNIEATGGVGAAGIGVCGATGINNSITIYGGTITATGGRNGAGIGNNISTLNTTITIYGGEITATGGTNGAGIGGGMNKAGFDVASCATVNIYGGTITATGSRYEHIEGCPDLAEYYPAGIGGGNRFMYCTVNIYGGNITAKNYGGNASYFENGYGIRGQVTLSYKNANDSIYATNYGGSVTVAGGKTFIVDGAEISGTVEVVKVEKQLTQTETAIVDTCPALDGKTLIPPSYNVSIGTTGLIASTAKAFPGETVTLSPTEGYNLTAVYVDGSAITGTTFAMPAKDVTVTGTLTPITYTITYELNDGTVAQANPSTYTVETETFTLNNPTKTGYNFDGWSSFVGGVKVMSMTVKKGSTGNKTCIANWTINQYTLTFDTQGGSEVGAITQDYDTAITAPDDPVRDAYEFKGWDKSIPAKMPAENMTFTAQWTAESYAISYELNGGTVTGNPTSYTIESDAITLNNPTKDGYTFAGWTGTGLKSATDTVTIAKGSTGNRNYTATWTAHTYTVKFNANNGTGDEMDAQGFTYGSDNTALTTNTYTREGYNFAGWNTQADGNGTDYSDAQAVQNLTSEANVTVTLYAKWTAIPYTITYDLDGGTATDNPTKYTIESDDFTLTNPTKDGSTFAGWTGTGLSSATMSVTIEKGSTGDRSYTATWTQSSWTPSDENTPEFAYHSLILSGQIGVIFQVYVPEGTSSKDYCMYFDVSGDKSQNTQPVYPFEEFTEDGNKFFGFKCYINSVQMADEIHAVLNYGDDKTLDYTYTAKRYLDKLIADTTQSEDVTELGRAIKDYGSYVQPILAAENNWEIGKKHAKMDAAYDFDDTDFKTVSNDTKDYAIVCNVPEGSGIKNVSFALVLDSETAIEIYLTSKDSYTGTVIAHVDGGTENMAVKKGSEYVVSIGNVSAHLLGKEYTVNVATGDVNFDVKISALSYVQSAIHDKSEAMKQAVTSLYRYWKATMTYRSNRSEYQ